MPLNTVCRPEPRKFSAQEGKAEAEPGLGIPGHSGMQGIWVNEETHMKYRLFKLLPGFGAWQKNTIPSLIAGKCKDGW